MKAWAIFKKSTGKISRDCDGLPTVYATITEAKNDQWDDEKIEKVDVFVVKQGCSLLRERKLKENDRSFLKEILADIEDHGYQRGGKADQMLQDWFLELDE